MNSWAQVADMAPTTTSADVWYNALPRVINQKRASDYAGNVADFYGQNSLFHCPAAKFATTVNTAPDAYFSIAFNSKLATGSTGSRVKISSAQRPSITVLFLENRLDGETPVDSSQPTSGLGQPASFASRFVARHNMSGDLAFADGHAAAFKGNKVVQTAAGDPNKGKAILPQTEVCWTLDPAVAP